jgi:hypothetical protein
MAGWFANETNINRATNPLAILSRFTNSLIFPNTTRMPDLFTEKMDPNLELYKSLLHLPPWERRTRMEHLTEKQFDRIKEIIRTEEDAQRQEEFIAGRDLVQVALTDPSGIIEDEQLQYTLLGRTLNSHDEDIMVKRITNNDADCGLSLVRYIRDFDEYIHPLCLDAWKLVYCDIRYVCGGSATLQEIYEARLQEEELQTPAARARELVRDDNLKKARRNAKWMIPAIERLSADELVQPSPEDEESHRRILEWVRMLEPDRLEYTESTLKHMYWGKNLERTWKQVSPAPPAWIQKILDTQRQWGFIYYVSRGVDEKYLRNWKSNWSRYKSPTSPMRTSWGSIHCQGRDNRTDLEQLITENWPIFHPNKNMGEHDDLRK